MIAAEIDAIGPFPTVRKLVGYSGLAPTLVQFGPKLRHRANLQA